MCEAVTNCEQIFLLSPLLVKDGLEGGQISNAEGEELHSQTCQQRTLEMKEAAN